jgi:WD40 repeat protein
MHRLPAFHLFLGKFRICFVFLCCACFCACSTTILSNPRHTPTSVSRAGTPLHYYSDQLVASAIAWSPDSKHVAILGMEGFDKFFVQVWNLSLGKKEVTYQEQFVSNGPVLAWSPDGQRIASGGEVIHIWNAATGQTQITYTSSTTGFYFVSALAWSPDGSRIALAGSRTHGPDQVQVWDIRTGQMLWKAVMQARVRAVAWSGNGKWLAVANEIAVQLRDPGTGQVLQSYSGYTGVVTSISWSPDSTYLASSESGGTVRLQSVSSGQSRSFFSTGGAEPIFFVSWSPKGRYLAFSPTDDTVQIWDISAKRLIATCSVGGENSVLALDWSPDGTMIATADTSTFEGFEIWRAIP